jgi:hypothetical protein
MHGVVAGHVFIRVCPFDIEMKLLGDHAAKDR